MARLPTVVDVAAVAGVSRQTVSNVLNAPEVVRPETRKRVQQAIAELRYRPHASARRLRTQRSRMIGVRLDPIVDGITGTLLDRFLHALVDKAEQAENRILLYTAADEPAELEQLDSLVEGADVDAVVLTSTHHGDTRVDWLMARGVPFVTFGRPWGVPDMYDPRHLWVDVDGYTGLRLSTQHLLDAGAQRIAFLGWPAGSGIGDERRRGWRDTMRAATGWSDAEIDGLDLALPNDAAESVVAAHLQRLQPPVDGVVCASDSLALKARLALNNGTPIVGYDDTSVARALNFSSVVQPLDEVAGEIVKLLMGTGTGEPDADPRHRLLQPRLAVR